MKNLKLVGYLAIVIMVANVFLFAFGMINDLIFWAIIIVGALFAYKVLPKLRK